MKPNKINLFRVIIFFTILLAVFGLTGYGTITLFPDVGAQGANLLRSILGNQVVASLETIVFQVQDQIETIRYRTGMSRLDTPWDFQPAKEQGITAVEPTEIPQSHVLPAPEVVIVNEVSHEMAVHPTPEITSTPAIIPTQRPTPTPAKWALAPLKPFGNMPGEGVWSDYIQNHQGHTVAYRTFLQPDPDRPYAVVGIVAFNLSKTRLNFILGTDEPYGGGPRRSGKIPENDLAPNRLLATFNGGFQATHGQYGAMADGLVALPFKDKIGTVVIWKNGKVDIGEWGRHFKHSDEMKAIRQNCPLVIDDGEINPLVNQNRVQDWGGTIEGHIVTWRSAIGINQDRTVLYYIAGSKLNMPIMAKTLLNVGAYRAIQLDINESWVHFVAIRPKGQSITVEPLFNQGMTFRPDRYLTAYSRDYFYVTTND